MAEFDAARQEDELVEAHERLSSLLAAARAWNGEPEDARKLIEESRELGQQLEAICVEISVFNDEELASTQSALSHRR